jgi:exonuclease VII small subunit
MKDFLADSQQISKNRLAGELQEIINQLEMVKRGTTNYNEAQSLLESARKKLKLIM